MKYFHFKVAIKLKMIIFNFANQIGLEIETNELFKVELMQNFRDEKII